MNDRDAAYDAFASYATDPDYRTVRIVERFLESLHTRGGVRKAKLTPLRVCVDGSDFSLPKADRTGARDPIRTILESYLTVSANLILFCSRGAAASLHVDQELAFFLEQRGAEAVLCVVTEGSDPVSHPEEVFPPRAIEAGMHRVPWYDLRGLRRLEAKQWIKVRDAEDEMFRLAAHLWGATAGAIYPSWQRARRRTRRLMIIAAGLAAAAVLAGAATVMYQNSDTYARRETITRRAAGLAPTSKRVAALASAGAFDEAERNIAEITDPGEQAQALFELANARAASYPEEAKALYRRVLAARNIGYSGNKADVIVNSILAGVERSGIEAYIKTLDPITESPVVGWALEKLVKRGRIDDALYLAGNDPATLFFIARNISDRSRAYALLRRIETISPPQPRLEDADPTSTAVAFPQEEFNANNLMDGYLKIDHPDDALRVAKAARESTASIGAYFVRKGDIARGTALISDPFDAASIFLDAGRLDAAESSIGKVPEPYIRARLMTDLAEKRLAKGEGEKARAALNEASRLPGIEEETVRRALIWKAAGDPQRGAALLREALRDVNPAMIYSGASSLVVALAKLGFVDDAFRFAEKLDSDTRASTRKGILDLVMERSGFDAALRAAKDDDERDHVQLARSKDAAGRGDDATVIKAFEAVKLHKTARQQISLLEAVRTLIEGGYLEAASRVADRLSDAWGIDLSHEELAAAWVKKRGNGRAALIAARGVKQPLRRACALASTAAELAKKNVTSGVHEAANEAASTARTTSDTSDKDRYLECIGSSLASAHETDLALGLARAVNGDSVRDAILAAVIADLASRGEFKRARATANDIREGRSRDAAMNTIIAASVEKTRK